MRVGCGIEKRSEGVVVLERDQKELWYRSEIIRSLEE
jgi:hypothetical protein